MVCFIACDSSFFLLCSLLSLIVVHCALIVRAGMYMYIYVNVHVHIHIIHRHDMIIAH